MFVSRKEFKGLKKAVATFSSDALEAKKEASLAMGAVDTLTKQIKCKCENYEVQNNPVLVTNATYQDGRLSWFYVEDSAWEDRHTKVCKDCGWTTTYDTEEEALADKQELLDKQIDALKEQKKALKSK